MAVPEPSAHPAVRGSRLRVLLWALLLLVGIGAGIGIFLVRTSGTSATDVGGPVLGGPAATWKAGQLAAPAFRLHDANGRPVSIAQYRGRPLILTFVDPLCTTFCPRESVVLNNVLKGLPPSQRPPVIAVNVNPPVEASAKLNAEARRFGWLPQWRWATGAKPQLKTVWHDYGITVLPTKGDVTHTEGAYLIDANGDQRALFLWPFSARDVLSVYKTIG